MLAASKKARGLHGGHAVQYSTNLRERERERERDRERGHTRLFNAIPQSVVNMAVQKHSRRVCGDGKGQGKGGATDRWRGKRGLPVSFVGFHSLTNKTLFDFGLAQF